MIYSDILQKIKNFSLIVNQNNLVQSVSNNILESDIGRLFFNMEISSVFTKDIMFDGCNSIEEILNSCNILEYIKQSFLGTDTIDKHCNISIDTGKDVINYTFLFTATLLNGVVNGVDRKVVSLLIKDYNKFDSELEQYLNHFQQFENQFDLLKKVNLFGRFIINFEKNKHNVYGNAVLPDLLGLKKSKDNFYKLKDRHEDADIENAIVAADDFHDKINDLVNGNIDVITDEWKVSEKWLRLEAKTLTRTSKGKPKIVGGVVYDITDFDNNQDLKSSNMFYELAISSGELGMFHYDLDKHDTSVFSANKRYGELMGLETNEKGLYKTEDFLSAQLSIEEDISIYEDAHIQSSKLLKGEIEGTNDDVLKVKNLKTGEIKYLLSSSKTESFFENGKPKRLGGIVLDITDRITKAKNQTEFLHKDELTSLGNNRLLAKNLLVANDGLGLFFDLDNFKKINDTYGHLMGDKMIKVFGFCLNKIAKEYENISVYRLYGDEFFVFCETRHKSFGFIYERRVKELLLKEMKKTDEKIVLEASMGAAMFKKGSNTDDFIKNADYSMYETKMKKKKREN